MRRKLIVHLTAEYTQSLWGGIATAVDLISKSMARDHFKVVVISCGPSDFDEHIEGNLDHIQIGWGKPSPCNIYSATNRVQLGSQVSKKMLEILTRLATNNNLMVLVHNEEFVDAIELGKKLPRVEFFAVSHGLVEQEHPDRADLAAQQRRYLQSAKAVIVHSDAQKKLLLSHYPSIQAYAIPLPLELLCFEIPQRRSLSKVKNRRLIAAGRDVPQKGFDLIAESLSLLPNIDPIECIIFSSRQPPLNSEAQDIKGTPHIVRKMKWKERTELLQEMCNAHAILVPSRFEPLGLVAAEAMSLGTPVIVSDVGGLGELVGEDLDVGLRISMNTKGPDPRALSEAISFELSNPPRVSSGCLRLSQFTYLRFRSSLEQLPGGLYYR